MGSLQSSALGHFNNVNTHNVDEGGPVFVIPRHINFTPVQMSTMISVGQQPGVPFRVGGEGARRPSRPTKKAQITNNLGSIYKNSFTMAIADDGNFSVHFKYDAVVPLTLRIYFGAKDAHSVKEIRPKRVSHHWGPFDLSVGKNLSWNSASEFVHGDIQNLTCSYESDKENGQSLHYDFIVILDATMQSNEYLKTKDASAVVIQASYYSVNKSSFKTEKNGHPEATKNNSTDGKVSDREAEWNRQQQSQSSTMTSSSLRVHQHYEHLNMMHALYGVVGNISLTCRQQKVQMSSGDVYVVQDLYGMSTATTSGDNATTTTATDDQFQPDSTEEGDSSPAPIDNLDTDTSECVICLTDEKEVVVYPCRHMCMCITCAEALPSQGNKCPMCRRPASMLLRLKSKSVSY
mmetsp:Transcript_26933/g.50309  ORF Transcript_26933/g.50309 Transcript_26933/m.50309 type:complete len:405 (-) Transcript_26933:137-1351(-)